MTEKLTISKTNHLSDSWFTTEIFGGLNTSGELLDQSTNDGEKGIVGAPLETPSGIVRLSQSFIVNKR